MNLILNQKICSQCILPESFPGIKFDADGICNHCSIEGPLITKTAEKKKEYQQRLDELITILKGKSPAYDAIMAYSGGKDSSYTLKLLRDRYDLRVVALTFDNHFISSVALENIKNVTDKLQVDHIRFKPPWPTLKKLFCRTAKEDILALKTALEMAIPLVAFGWSPGQAPIQSAIMKTNPALIRQNQAAFKKALPAEFNSGMKQYFIPDVYYERDKEHFPYNIHPLAFFDYDEEKILHELKNLGWEAPLDTDTNSTNCLLNAFANQIHLQRHGFHPYALEIANMVRQGIMSREEGMEKIYSEQNQKMVDFARGKLGL